MSKRGPKIITTTDHEMKSLSTKKTRRIQPTFHHVSDAIVSTAGKWHCGTKPLCAVRISHDATITDRSLSLGRFDFSGFTVEQVVPKGKHHVVHMCKEPKKFDPNLIEDWGKVATCIQKTGLKPMSFFLMETVENDKLNKVASAMMELVTGRKVRVYGELFIYEYQAWTAVQNLFDPDTDFDWQEFYREHLRLNLYTLLSISSRLQ